MSEEKQGSTLGGVIGAVGGGAAAGSFFYKSGANNSINAAMHGLDGHSEGLAKAISEAAASDKALGDKLSAVKSLGAKDVADKIGTVTFTKATGENAKGFVATVSADATGVIKEGAKGIETAKRTVTQRVSIEALPKGVELKEGASSVKGTAEQAKKIFTTAQKDLTKSLRGNEVVKNAGSTFSHMSRGGKIGVVGGTIIGAVVGGIALSKMFGGGKHTAKVEADRGQAPAQAQSGGRG